jgi:dihydrolipoamide dehydrogenase
MVDVAIIGGGPGGFDTALYAKARGLSVILFEKGSLGGTCLNWGCIPTKALYHHASVLNTIKEADTFGIQVEHVSLSLESMRARKETIVTDQITNIRRSLKKNNIELIEAEANLVDAHTIKANDTLYEAKHIIIATGSTPKMIPFKGNDLEGLYTSKDLLELSEIPSHLTIIGAGVIGIEMASIFHALGSEVDVIEYVDKILPSLDSDLSKRAKSLLKRKGIKLHTKSVLKEVSMSNDGYDVTFEEKSKLKTIHTSRVLLATGRQPFFGNLPLEELGIKTTKEGITVNANKQTSLNHIYAIGDVNGENMLAHKATYDGYKAIDHILNDQPPIRFDLVPGVVFSFPEIASVGKREADLEKGTYTVHKTVYKSNAKAQCMNETDGFVKMICDQDKQLLGVHIIGAHAADLIHECTVMLNTNPRIDALFNVIHAHPTVSEVIGETIKHLHLN